MKRYLALLLVLASPLAAKEYRAQRFDVRVVLEPGGSARITETIVFRFGPDTFSYVYRDLPGGHHDGISEIQASMDGQPLSRGRGAGEAEVEGRRVTWHFVPVSNSAHVFELSYHARGVVRQKNGADAFVWPVIPRDRSYRIDEAGLAIEYPEAAALERRPVLIGAHSDMSSAPGRLAFSIPEGLRGEHGLTVETYFTPGKLIAAPPEWQAREMERGRRRAAAVPVGLAVMALVIAIGILALKRVYDPLRREPARFAPPRMTQPPDQLPPAIAARLAVGSGSAPLLALAVLFDFARRGIIRIEELPKRRFSGRDFAVRRAGASGTLAGYEQVIVSTLFETKKGPREFCRVSEFGQSFASRAGRFAAAVRDDMAARGLFDPERRAKRRSLFAASAVLFAGGLVAAVLSLAGEIVSTNFAAFFLGAAVGLLFLGVAAVIYGAKVSPLTISGDSAAVAWRAFAGYLKDVAKGRTPGPAHERIYEWMPYAAGFGLAERWTKHLKQQGMSDVPEWFHALGTAGGEEMAAMVALMSASSSSADGGGAGGGAGGAGGGGSGAG